MNRRRYLPLRLLVVSLSLLNAVSAIAQETPQRASGMALRPDKVIFPDEPVFLEMKMRGCQPAVEVKVNGKGPFLFAIDTGGQGSARVDTSLVEKLDLKVVDQVQGGDPSGRKGPMMDMVKLDSIQVGTARFENVTALSRDYNRHPGIPSIDGILCCHLFSDLVLTLDYPGRKVLIEAGPLKMPREATVLPITSDPDFVHAFSATLDGIKINEMLLDTGKMSGLGIARSIVEKLTWKSQPVVFARGRTVTGEIEMKRGQVKGKLVMGSVTVEDPWVDFCDIMPKAIVGSRFLADYVVSVDAKSRCIWLRKPDAKAQVDRPEKSKGNE